MTVDLEAMRKLADELDSFGAGTPEMAMPEIVGEGADAIRMLVVELERHREK